MICDICKRTDIKNLGVHKRFCGKTKKESPILDDIMEKPLSELILEVRDVLKGRQNIMTIKTIEHNGKITEVELTARIQL